MCKFEDKKMTELEELYRNGKIDPRSLEEKLEHQIDTDSEMDYFESYKEDAVDATRLYQGLGAGTLRAIMTAKQTQKMGLYLLQIAKRYILPIVLLAFTFDLEIYCQALIEAGEMGCDVQVFFDKGQSLGHTTRDMAQRLMRLRAHHVKVKLLQGGSLKDGYKAVGRSAPGGNGRLHAKCLCVGRMLVAGSCNWTTSSSCNKEVNTLVDMNEAGQEDFRQLVQTWAKTDD